VLCWKTTGSRCGASAAAVSWWFGAARLFGQRISPPHPFRFARTGCPVRAFCLLQGGSIMATWIKWFAELTIDDVPSVGGKNASLGEMIRELTPRGIQVPDGFAVTADAYRAFLHYNELDSQIADILRGLDTHDVSDLMRRTGQIRRLILRGEFPPDMEQEIITGYQELSRRYGARTTDVAVRSSATAEDLPTASFAGQQETYLNVHGEAMLLESVTKCFASLFTPRATSYRQDMGFAHTQVGLSVGVQKMVRSDLASSGVIFTLDTESGFRDVVFVTSAYGLGENVVQGRVAPDEFYVFKPTLRQGFRPLIWKRLGTKEQRMIYDEAGSKLVKNVQVSPEDRARFSVRLTTRRAAASTCRWTSNGRRMGKAGRCLSSRRARKPSTASASSPRFRLTASRQRVRCWSKGWRSATRSRRAWCTSSPTSVTSATFAPAKSWSRTSPTPTGSRS
jgi:hypothetical protein